MYRFTMGIGKGSRQALRKLEVTWVYSQCDHPEYYLSQLADCINLQRLHIGLNHWIIKDLRLLNIDESKDKDIDI